MKHSVLSLAEAFGIERGELVSIVGGGGKTSLMFGLAAELGRGTVLTTTTRIFAAQMKRARRVVVHKGEAMADIELGLGQDSFVLVVGEVVGDKAHGIGADLTSELIKRPDVDFVIIEADGSRTRPCKAPADHEPVIPAETTLVVPVVGIDALGGRVGEVAHRPERVAALTGLGDDDSITAEALATLIVDPDGGRKGVPVGARVVPLINKVETKGQLKAAREVARLVLREPEIERVVIGAVRYKNRVVEVQQRVTAVVLAAGEGRRMGERTKQLLPWGETTVLGQTIRNVKGSAVHEVIVVTGYEAARVETAVEGEGVVVVHNPDYEAGEMLSSLQIVVRGLGDGCAAVLVMLADQPMVEAETLDEILTAFWQGRGDLVAPIFEGRRGNPVLIGRRFFEELLALSQGAAPRDLVKRHADSLYLVEVGSDSILRDLDRPEDYDRFRP